MPVDINSIVLMLFFKLCITGNLQSTETIYKYYIQVQEEEDNDDFTLSILNLDSTGRREAPDGVVR